jgi:hypothetical protein
VDADKPPTLIVKLVVEPEILDSNDKREQYIQRWRPIIEKATKDAWKRKHQIPENAEVDIEVQIELVSQNDHPEISSPNLAELGLDPDKILLKSALKLENHLRPTHQPKSQLKSKHGWDFKKGKGQTRTQFNSRKGNPHRHQGR